MNELGGDTDLFTYHGLYCGKIILLLSKERLAAWQMFDYVRLSLIRSLEAPRWPRCTVASDD